MTINIRQREVVGSALEIFRRIGGRPVWGYPEAIFNCFTAVKDHKHIPLRVAYITLKVPNDQGSYDAWIEDPGVGFVSKYYYLENKMGYDTRTDEYKRDQMDPNCLNKMGIGINSIAALSKTGQLEFRTVSLNEQGQEMGLVCRYLGHDTAWQLPADPLSPEYVLGRKEGQVKTGTRVIIKNVKEHSLKTVETLLIDVFARKLGGKDGYKIGIRETPNENYKTITRPPNGPIICTCYETVIGRVKNKYGVWVDVRADLHPVEKAADAKVKFLVKKIKMGIYENNDFLMKGHVWCDATEFRPDRQGIVIDEYDEVYHQIEEVITRHAIENGYRLKSEDTSGDKDIKGKKTWEQKGAENVLKYYKRFGDDSLLPLKALKQSSILDGEPAGKLALIRRNRKAHEEEKHGCPKGQRWDAELGKCVDIQHTGRKNKKHKHRSKTPKTLSSEYDLDSIPKLEVVRGNRQGKTGWYVELDVKTSTLWLDTHYAWVRDNENLDAASSEAMDLLLMVAIMKAVPENRDLSEAEFFGKLVEAL